jgi:hypothetical protein
MTVRRDLDLTKALRSIPSGRHQTFVKAVRSFEAAASVSLDLKAVKRSVELLLRYTDEPEERAETGVCDALLTHAVVIYARATDTSSPTRFKVGADKAYTAGQKETHHKIMLLRNKCLAHFGPGEGLWNEDRVIYFENDNEAGLTTVHRRTNFDTEVARELLSLVDTAIPYVNKLQKQRAEALSEAIGTYSSSVTEFVESSHFDVSAFYGGRDDAIKQFMLDEPFTVSVSHRAVKPTD